MEDQTVIGHTALPTLADFIKQHYVGEFFDKLFHEEQRFTRSVMSLDHGAKTKVRVGKILSAS